ncbi:hypothetical protein JTE90_021924 [Oedothorax gibbosus]|uniref:Uncharacterized protein n=1 Tax=Oedothorax gibbosus TaxID=931172 RepID=A0AAV6VVX0_9ARAC|nr:hypothetical protein JTE90_021924 [Oedothorax gibbosus]
MPGHITYPVPEGKGHEDWCTSTMRNTGHATLIPCCMHIKVPCVHPPKLMPDNPQTTSILPHQPTSTQHQPNTFFPSRKEVHPSKKNGHRE